MVFSSFMRQYLEDLWHFFSDGDSVAFFCAMSASKFPLPKNS